MRFLAILTLTVCVLAGGQTRAHAKASAGLNQNIASGTFLASDGRNAPADDARILDFAVGNGGYVYENVSGQRKWPSRDPIGERGGFNLYGMIGNDAVSRIDVLGLESSRCPCDSKQRLQGEMKLEEQRDSILEKLKSGEIGAGEPKSCSTWHDNLLENFKIPKCWECRKECRSYMQDSIANTPDIFILKGFVMIIQHPWKMFKTRLVTNHCVVICHSRDHEGKIREERIFDITGGYTNINKFRTFYPDIMHGDENTSNWISGQCGGPLEKIPPLLPQIIK